MQHLAFPTANSSGKEAIARATVLTVTESAPRKGGLDCFESVLWSMHVVLAVPTSFLVGTAVLFGCAEKRKRN